MTVGSGEALRLAAMLEELLASYGIFALSAFFRAFGLLAVLPLGAAGVVNAQKVAWSLGLACLSIPFAAEIKNYGGIQMGEDLVLGALMGLPAALLVSVIAMWGELFESLRGQTISALYDPLSETQEPAFAVMLRSGFWAMLLAAGLGETLVRVYLRSLRGATFPGASIGWDSIAAVSARTLRLITEELNLLFVLALPVAGATLLSETAIGLFGKIAPQISIRQEAFIVRTLVLGFLLSVWWRSDLIESLVLRGASTARVLESAELPHLQSAALVGR